MSILRKDLRGRCEHYRSEGSLSNWLRTCPHKGVVENLDFRVTKLKNVKDLCIHNLFLYHLNGQTDLFTIWTNNKQRISFTSCTNQSHLPQSKSLKLLLKVVLNSWNTNFHLKHSHRENKTTFPDVTPLLPEICHWNDPELSVNLLSNRKFPKTFCKW